MPAIASLTQELTVSTVRELSEFEALSDRWNALVHEADATPFMLSDYVAASWRQSAGECWCVMLWRGERLVAGLPVTILPRLGLRRGVLLCGPQRSDLLVDRNEPDTTGPQLLRATERVPLDWLPVRGVLPSSTLARSLAPDRLSSEGVKVMKMAMPDGWQSAYRERLSSKHRNTDRRKLRRLQELGKVEFDVATSGEHLQGCMTEAFALYERRWRNRPGEAGGFSEAHGWREVAAALGARGHTQLVVLRAGGRPLAFTYSYLLNQTMWLHRLAFDPDASEYSPGWLAVLQALDVASNAGARCVDLGFGEEAYKRKLATSSSDSLWGTALTSGSRGRLGRRIEETNNSLRKRAKRSERVLAVRDAIFHARRRLSSTGEAMEA